MRAFRLLALPALLLALLVSACGGGSESVAVDAADTAQGNDSVVRPDMQMGDTESPDATPNEDEQTPPEDVAVGCVADGDPCDDGNPCTAEDECAGGVCTGIQKDCDDANDCTAGECDPGTGECVQSPLDARDCDDMDPCTTGDRCQAGVCTGAAAACDDENPCTADSCAPATGECAHEPTEGEPCDDGNRCTFNGTCDAEGTCVGEHVDCEDGVACTNDVCTPAGECVHVAAKSNCDDGLACTADFCDPVNDCQHAGVLADEPTQDGSIAEWSAEGVVAENDVPTDVAGSDLRSLSVSVSRDALHVGIQGTVGAGQAWLVFFDLEYLASADGVGVRDLSTITGADAISQAAAADTTVAASGFGADFVIGGTTGASGCRTLNEDGTTAAADCDIAVNLGQKSVEVRVPWTSLFGRVPTEEDLWTVGGFALVANATTHAPSNQVLPGQALPVEQVFFFPVSGGQCLAAFCGDGIVDPGEACDDGNDDPLDDCAGCAQPAPPGMVTVPGGEFVMGRDSERLDDPWRPAHVVAVDTFFIDRYETTASEFAEFLNAKNYEVSANTLIDEDGHPLYQCADTHSTVDCGGSGTFRPEPGFDDHPIGETSWWAAYRYCQWKGKRLPTEAEWEKSARGLDERLYPWGDAAEPGALNCQESSCRDGFDYTAPVGSFPEGVSPYGVHDMAGNVWEWVNDWFDARYYEVSPYENPRGPCDGALTCAGSTIRIARGGSWDDPFPFPGESLTRLATYYRYPTSPDCNSDIGIRCAMSVPDGD